jgi:hypothetical protein
MWQEWNLEPEVAKVVAGLREVKSEAQAVLSGGVYSEFHDSIGHNHSGAYYPVALTALDPLEEILCKGSSWARFVVLNILFDLYCSFYPVTGNKEEDKVLGQQLQSKIGQLLPLHVQLSESQEPDAKAARELADAIQQGLAQTLV